ncbi:OsmC family protein [Mucilaginibacter aquatilis]|uniref:OsmC family peroxiredoxin n=1 Tax=Mucilaginibacter aquatilis TaxID=1517760 RepID=A0A6I4IB64_9SPHI|nr:OsmC family protein [Mucilaginibacter aquatilis]MVN91178.1 OsmC family peroxiredoxin [Mucilaginibacter aquatilis]
MSNQEDKKPIAQGRASIARAHYQTVATSGNHAIVADEPADLGGTDTGMTPFGLLLSSLGTCTAITLRMYIDRKMWIVDEINIDLEIFAVPDGHCIEIAISFKGDLTAEQTERLLDIADKCPVHKLLAGNVKMESRLA